MRSKCSNLKLKFKTAKSCGVLFSCLLFAARTMESVDRWMRYLVIDDAFYERIHLGGDDITLNSGPITYG